MEQTMGIVMLLVGGGLMFSLLVFFTCEEKSLKDANFSDMKCMVTKEVGVTECFSQFNTIRYLGIFFITLIFFNSLVANYVAIPNGFGMKEILAYTFVPSLLGSCIILLVKWTYQPVMKLISSFLYGATFIAASVIVFSTTALFNS
ncbi:hypothetical protein N9A28_04705 [Sulfurimonas sp.]|nr:hypothetical protein [Sulfurimonas sp.]